LFDDNYFHGERKIVKMFDPTDLAIIDLLRKNSRMQWREIGEQVHLTGQAVANRIRRMEELGLLRGYTINVDNGKLGKSVVAFVTVFMKTTEHQAFQKFVKNNDAITEADRISGDGCYFLKVRVSSNEELREFLNSLLEFGNYRVNLSIGKMK
jgi:Lrp/AsnC family transcriptional regulator, leucine-responsive regulatory protein